jgi:hypothetical protein
VKETYPDNNPISQANTELNPNSQPTASQPNASQPLIINLPPPQSGIQLSETANSENQPNETNDEEILRQLKEKLNADF